MLYRISVAERGLTGIANIFRSRLSGLDDLLQAGTVPLTFAISKFFSFFSVDDYFLHVEFLKTDRQCLEKIHAAGDLFLMKLASVLSNKRPASAAGHTVT